MAVALTNSQVSYLSLYAEEVTKIWTFPQEAESRFQQLYPECLLSGRWLFWAWLGSPEEIPVPSPRESVKPTDQAFQLDLDRILEARSRPSRGSQNLSLKERRKKGRSRLAIAVPERSSSKQSNKKSTKSPLLTAPIKPRNPLRSQENDQAHSDHTPSPIPPPKLATRTGQALPAGLNSRSKPLIADRDGEFRHHILKRREKTGLRNDTPSEAPTSTTHLTVPTTTNRSNSRSTPLSQRHAKPSRSPPPPQLLSPSGLTQVNASGIPEPPRSARLTSPGSAEAIDFSERFTAMPASPWSPRMTGLEPRDVPYTAYYLLVQKVDLWGR